MTDAAKLSHLDSEGAATMVDVSDKKATAREASASARIKVSADARDALNDARYKKGDVMAVARVAAISAAKQTATLIPLCHQVPLSSCKVDFEVGAEVGVDGRYPIAIRVRVKTVYGTGVEMEALTAASVAALTFYDMLKAVDREMVIEQICLETKTGGRSGDFSRA